MINESLLEAYGLQNISKQNASRRTAVESRSSLGSNRNVLFTKRRDAYRNRIIKLMSFTLIAKLRLIRFNGESNNLDLFASNTDSKDLCNTGYISFNYEAYCNRPNSAPRKKPCKQSRHFDRLIYLYLA
jgi:hypothetical protein